MNEWEKYLLKCQMEERTGRPIQICETHHMSGELTYEDAEGCIEIEFFGPTDSKAIPRAENENCVVWQLTRPGQVIIDGVRCKYADGTVKEDRFPRTVRISNEGDEVEYSFTYPFKGCGCKATWEAK